jgi:hypothetical protein
VADFTAELDLVETAVDHVSSEIDIILDGVVIGDDTVGVFGGLLDVKGDLDLLINDAVSNLCSLALKIQSTANMTYTKGVEVKLCSYSLIASDLLILSLKVVEERRTVVTTVRFGPQVELFALHNAIQLGKRTVETLKDLPRSDRSKIGGIEYIGVYYREASLVAVHRRVLEIARDFIQ